MNGGIPQEVAEARARTEQCAKEVQFVLKRYGCQLVGVPAYTPDGRTVALVQIDVVPEQPKLIVPELVPPDLGRLVDEAKAANGKGPRILEDDSARRHGPRS